jgi:hypothetical protein
MTHEEPDVAKVDTRFARVVNAFAKDQIVSCGGTKGFGSGALKVKGKIFAMLSSKREFVVKLPRGRVDELVESGEGRRFDLGRGRQMKEWLVIKAARADWTDLAKEACEFVKRGKG